ncbi:alpha/beta fold hydrolase [Patulibacter minatonensis]|uniref:alpha/beta fold hydrolase n=1 Tax=Patulibacter minatonensis TaxID=298163 RepID=UPI00047BA0D0|nr:alpha/beta hydrolase [Patulibacter minatonensis]
MPAPSHPVTFDTGKLRVSGERRGAPSADRPTVVFLHGGGQTRHSWSRTTERLAADGWATVALDARGHGDSEWDADGDYSMDGFAGDLIAVLEELPGPAVLVGASMGGLTSLVVAGEHPELVAGLVLVDVVIRLRQDGVDRIIDFMAAHPDGFATLDEVADAVAAHNPTRERPRNVDGLRKNVRQGPDGRWRWHWDPAFIRLTEVPGRIDDEGRLDDAARRIAVPTLLVRGVQSDVVDDEGVADLRERIAGAEVVDVAEAGHMVAGDDNDVFAGALEAYLERVGATR